MAAFGSATQVLQANKAAWQGVVGAGVADALGSEPPELAPRLRAARAWLQGGEQRQVLCIGDSQYPAVLLQTADPPLLLYVQGRVELLQQRSLAIVGSRNASPQGVDNARSFAAHMSRQGWTIVSGLAFGIDGAAHEGGLAGPGSTVAVVGTGLDRVYPARHRELAHRIASAGVLVSEFAPRHAAAGRELPAAQPHHRRPVARYAGGGSRAAIGLADHRAAGDVGRARGVSRCPDRSIRRCRAAAMR